MQHHRAVQGRCVRVEVRIEIHDPRQAHDSAADDASRGGPSDGSDPGALDDDVELDVDVSGVAGVVARAELFDQVALRSALCEVDRVHLVATLHAEQTCEQPDRPCSRYEHASTDEERAPGDPIDLFPRLREHGRRLQQNAELAERASDRNCEFGVQAPSLASVAIRADDAALTESVVAAHVPLPGGAGRARHRIGAPHDSDDQVARLKARVCWRVQHLAETLMADDQFRVPRRWLAVCTLGISRSVPQTPTSSPRTARPPTSSPGSGTSSTVADPGRPGSTVIARTRAILALRRS